jgi:excisionase family DNA binding protein
MAFTAFQHRRASRPVFPTIWRIGDVQMNADIFTTPEAAEYCKLGKSTLDRFRVTGEGPRYSKLGGSVRYRRADLDAWLESRLVSSTSEEVGQS